MKMMSSNSILGCSHLMMLMKNNLPYICMVMCNIVYAGMVLLSKAVISKGMNPYIFGAYLQAFATLALAPFAFYLERKNSAPLSCSILCKILVSLIGITRCLNLWNISLCYIPATFASATSNAIPAITFIMAILLRMESIAITEWSGVAKVLGTMLCVGGAVVYSFVKGPPVYPQGTQDQNSQSYTGCGTKAQCLKGSLFALSVQANWSLWLIMQTISNMGCGSREETYQHGNLGVIFVAPTFWLRIWVIEKRGPVFSAAFNPLAFIVIAIFSAFLWKETPHWGSVCGALLVGGLYGVLWGMHKEAKAKPLLEQKSKTKEAKSVEQKSETKEESV
ncbi:hypothetical protein CsSME_00034943 [Camellia sinensis var. sinensis]